MSVVCCGSVQLFPNVLSLAQASLEVLHDAVVPFVQSCFSRWRGCVITVLKRVSHIAVTLFDRADMVATVLLIASNVSFVVSSLFRRLCTDVFVEKVSQFVDVIDGMRGLSVPSYITCGDLSFEIRTYRIVRLVSSILWSLCDVAATCFFFFPDIKDRTFSVVKNVKCSVETICDTVYTIGSTCFLVDLVYRSIKKRSFDVADALNVFSSGCDIVSSFLPLVKIESDVVYAALSALSYLTSFIARFLPCE